MQRTPMADAVRCVAIRTALPDSSHLPPDTNLPLSKVFLNRKKRAGEALFCEKEAASPPFRDVLCRMMLHPPNWKSPPSEVSSNRKKRAGKALFCEKEAASPPFRDVFSPPKNRYAEPAQRLFTLHFSLFTSRRDYFSLCTFHYSLPEGTAFHFALFVFH